MISDFIYLFSVNKYYSYKPLSLFTLDMAKRNKVPIFDPCCINETSSDTLKTYKHIRYHFINKFRKKLTIRFPLTCFCAAVYYFQPELEQPYSTNLIVMMPDKLNKFFWLLRTI